MTGRRLNRVIMDNTSMNIDKLQYGELDRSWSRTDFSSLQREWARLGNYDGSGDKAETVRAIFALMKFALDNDLPFQFYPAGRILFDAGQYEETVGRATLYLSSQIEISVNTGLISHDSVISVRVILPYKSPHFICECMRENSDIRDMEYIGANKLRLEGDFGRDYESHVAGGEETSALQVLTPDVMATIIDLHPERLELCNGEIMMVGLSLDYLLSGRAFYHLLSGCRLITGEFIGQLSVMNLAKSNRDTYFKPVGKAEQDLRVHEVPKYIAKCSATLVGLFIGYIILTWSYWMDRDEPQPGLMLAGAGFLVFIGLVFILSAISIRFRKRQ